MTQGQIILDIQMLLKVTAAQQEQIDKLEKDVYKLKYNKPSKLQEEIAAARDRMKAEATSDSAP